MGTRRGRISLISDLDGRRLENSASQSHCWKAVPDPVRLHPRRASHRTTDWFAERHESWSPHAGMTFRCPATCDIYPASGTHAASFETDVLILCETYPSSKRKARRDLLRRWNAPERITQPSSSRCPSVNSSKNGRGSKPASSALRPTNDPRVKAAGCIRQASLLRRAGVVFLDLPIRHDTLRLRDSYRVEPRLF